MSDRRQVGLTQHEIVAALRALGLSSGASVLMHSSLRSPGLVAGGADTVVSALREAIAPGGTVLALTLTGTERDSPAHPPIFDPRTSRAWTGAIPDAVWRHPLARRSRHPTHSVAGIGPATTHLIRDHEYCATPCDARSPYGRLAEMGGFILLLGVTHESNTSLHMVEELAAVPYHLQERLALARVARTDGADEQIPTRLHLWHWDRDFPKVEPLLQASGAQHEGYVGQARARLVNAHAMRDLLVPILRHDPLFLLAATARSEYEQERSGH